jgi:hypothetical protein
LQKPAHNFDFVLEEFPFVPEGQGEQNVDPAKAYEPGKHTPLQERDVCMLNASPKVPASHRKHELLPGSEKWPNGHGTHEKEFAAAKVLEGQMLQPVAFKVPEFETKPA